MFQHTAARRRLPKGVYLWKTKLLVSTHSRPKAAAGDIYRSMKAKDVSTHSRPKAAACVQSLMRLPAPCFNTQPPEGGCIRLWWCAGWQYICFNTQPPEGGCIFYISVRKKTFCFNTQPPEGGCMSDLTPDFGLSWFQHTAARRRLLHHRHQSIHYKNVSTHSRPKAAARIMVFRIMLQFVSTHSRPKAAAIYPSCYIKHEEMFQHTAARRRLLTVTVKRVTADSVSTHSRPKAAAPVLII